MVGLPVPEPPPPRRRDRARRAAPGALVPRRLRGSRAALLLLTPRDREPAAGRPGSAAQTGVRRLFLALLGAVFGIAFVSLGVQAPGLFGRSGIAPAADLLEFAEQALGAAAPLRAPTLLWLARGPLDAGDGPIRAISLIGTLLSVALIVQCLLPAPARLPRAARAALSPGVLLVLLWALYLSLVSAGSVFLSFQWDVLLLETAVVALFYAPWRLSPDAFRRAPPCAGTLLLRWLLFRLMFLSGAVKLLSGDPSWRNLTALSYHYETQPLPAWTSWYAARLPLALHQAAAAATFAVELALPLLIFAPRRLRLAAAAGFLALQGGIAATGNYTFFNLLSAALCVPLLDDGLLARVPGLRRLTSASDAAAEPATAKPPRVWRPRAGYALAACLFALQTFAMLQRLGLGALVPPPAAAVLDAISPFRSVNAYGLFADMTEERPEILVEGSADGAVWRAYEFRWKPDRLDERPKFVQPHQPRLDWQMWFAALSTCRRTPWFLSFQEALLEGRPEVVALLGPNPFPEAPPRYVRATLHRYRFTSAEERRATGNWWRSEPLGPYCPVLTLRDGRLTAVEP